MRTEAIHPVPRIPFVILLTTTDESRTTRINDPAYADVRKVFSPNTNVEGWAHYDEQMMGGTGEQF